MRRSIRRKFVLEGVVFCQWRWNLFPMNFFRKPSKKSFLFLQDPFLKATLVNGSFRKITALPSGVDLNEWLASKTMDFWNFTQLFYHSICEYCDSNISMNAGGVEYCWIDVNCNFIFRRKGMH